MTTELTSLERGRSDAAKTLANTGLPHFVLACFFASVYEGKEGGYHEPEPALGLCRFFFGSSLKTLQACCTVAGLDRQPIRYDLQAPHSLDSPRECDEQGGRTRWGSQSGVIGQISPEIARLRIMSLALVMSPVPQL